MKDKVLSSRRAGIVSKKEVSIDKRDNGILVV